MRFKHWPKTSYVETSRKRAAASRLDRKPVSLNLACIPCRNIKEFNQDALMTSREIIKLLEKDGWSLVRVKGDHHHFKKPGVAFLVTVPHPTKDIKPGTLRNIYRQAGWKWPPE